MLQPQDLLIKPLPCAISRVESGKDGLAYSSTCLQHQMNYLVLSEFMGDAYHLTSESKGIQGDTLYLRQLKQRDAYIEV